MAHTHTDPCTHSNSETQGNTQSPTRVRRPTDTEMRTHAPQHRRVRVSTQTRCYRGCTDSPLGPVYSQKDATQTHWPAHACGAHLQAHTHASPHPPAQLMGTIAQQSPHPHLFMSVDRGQWAGPGPGSGGWAHRGGGGWSRTGRGRGWMTLDAWGRRARHGAALPPPSHEELINLMN